MALIPRGMLDNRDRVYWNSLAPHGVLTGLRQMMPHSPAATRRDGVSSHSLLTSGTAIVCGLVLPVHPMAFYAKGPVCRYCHAGTWTQFKYYLITSRSRRLVAETWKRLAQLMDSFARAYGGGEREDALCMHIMREGWRARERRDAGMLGIHRSFPPLCVREKRI